MPKKTIAGRPFAEIENILEDLPGEVNDIPAEIRPDTMLRGIFATVAHSNYVLAAILVELREIRKVF